MSRNCGRLGKLAAGILLILIVVPMARNIYNEATGHQEVIIMPDNMATHPSRKSFSDIQNDQRASFDKERAQYVK